MQHNPSPHNSPHIGAQSNPQTAQLLHIEDLCNKVFGNSSPSEKHQAQEELNKLQTSTENIPICQYLLGNSENPYVIVVASQALTSLITSHWNNFTSEQRIVVRNYILDYLATKGPKLEAFVTQYLVKLLCRITRLGWFDDPKHQQLAEECEKFLSATVQHCVIGLRILIQLVSGMNILLPGSTMSEHRKHAVSFRDMSLLKVFKVAIQMLQSLFKGGVQASPEDKQKLTNYAVDLGIECLNFDFIGMRSDESADDNDAIQVPISWRPLFLDPAYMKVMVDLYKGTRPPISSKAMELLMLWSSCRRSIFVKEADRSEFLDRILAVLIDIMKNAINLNDEDNYHSFCRLLGRMKNTYQLNELLRAKGWSEFIQLVTEFSVTSFQQWQWSQNSTHYILYLWSRLVSVTPFVRASQTLVQPLLEEYSPRIFESYVDARLQSAVDCSNDPGLENPLDNEEQIQEQLEQLPNITRYQYEKCGQFLKSRFDPIAQSYHQAITTSQHPGQLALYECQLAWLTYILGAQLGGHMTMASTGREGHEKTDALIGEGVFRLMQIVDQRLVSTNGAGKCDARLELSLMYFFQEFRRCYIGEHHGMPSEAEMEAIKAKKEKAAMGANDSLDSSDDEANMERPSTTRKSTAERKRAMYLRMFELMGLGDHRVVVNMLVTKVCNNMKFWADDKEVIGRSLDVFFWLSAGYGSGRFMLTLDAVKYLLTHHTGEFLPFLDLPENTRHRTSFYKTLARLVFLGDYHNLLMPFMEPILNVLVQLRSTSNYRQENVKRAIINVSRDMRGVLQSSTNKRTYSLLFDCLYPAYMPVFSRAADTWFDTPEVMNPLLKFYAELVRNKSQRIIFGESSANGILLFREASSLVCMYGSKLLQMPASQDATELYKTRYKGIGLSLNIISACLIGSYVNFGVFELYNDPALSNALNISMKLMLSIPLPEVMAYPKVTRSYFTYIEVLFRNQLETIVKVPTETFLRMIQALQEGLLSLDGTVSVYCASTIDHLASFQFRVSRRNKPEAIALQQHLASCPNIFTGFLTTLFKKLLFDGAESYWSLSRPVLSIILANDQAFEQAKQYLAATQPPQNHPKMKAEFDKLLIDVDRNLEPTNRDRFTQRITAMRNELKKLLIRPNQ
jgi:exportin-7